MLKKILFSDGSGATILIRMIVGFVFLSEGLQKFIIPNIRGVGRFINIGFPFPEFMSYFVATFELVCGIMILLGFLVRLASIPTLFIILVAIMATKIEVFSKEGVWEMLHDSRTDWAMLLSSIFLIIKGSGDFAIDYIIQVNMEVKTKNENEDIENKLKKSPDIYSGDYFYS